jgi:hypothetical protein
MDPNVFLPPVNIPPRGQPPLNTPTPAFLPAHQQHLEYDDTEEEDGLHDFRRPRIARFGDPSEHETNRILKMMPIFLKEGFPKIKLGNDLSTRGQKMLDWKIAMDGKLMPLGRDVTRWWEWCYFGAEETHFDFLRAPLQQQPRIRPSDRVPSSVEPVERYLRGYLLTSVPDEVNEFVLVRAKQHISDNSPTIVFYLFRMAGPGGNLDKINLSERLLQPPTCTKPKAALDELVNGKTVWKDTLSWELIFQMLHCCSLLSAILLMEYSITQSQLSSIGGYT